MDNNCEGSPRLKIELIVLSFAPLFFLTAIKNYEFNELYNHNMCLLIVMSICSLWLIYSLIIYFRFRMYRTFDCIEGFTIENVQYESDAGLNFWLTYAFPLLLDELDKWQNAIAFGIILLLMITLLYKTNLYYQNPILVILGYKVIHFNFTAQDDEMIGICPKEIDTQYVIKYKLISDNVVCIKQRERRNNDQRRISAENQQHN